MSYFHDWTNPTIEEIRKWAYDAEATSPEQDFALILATPDYIQELIELTADKTCPKRNFFLQTMYIFAGDAIRRANVEWLNLLSSLIQKGQSYNDELINIWAERVKQLENNPEKLNYSDWYENPKLAGVTHW